MKVYCFCSFNMTSDVSFNDTHNEIEVEFGITQTYRLLKVIYIDFDEKLRMYSKIFWIHKSVQIIYDKNKNWVLENGNTNCQCISIWTRNFPKCNAFWKILFLLISKIYIFILNIISLLNISYNMRHDEMNAS